MGSKWKHRLNEVNPDTGTATCAHCGPGTPVRFRKTAGRWVCRNQGDGKPHGKSVEEKAWNEARRKLAAEQGGMCAICGKMRKLVLDHNHQTGKARGALCTSCNAGIGLLQDSPDLLRQAADYIEENRG